MYKILDKQFKNKNEIVEECREIIRLNKGRILIEEDLTFVIEVLKNHPKWKNKSKNLKHIKVDLDKYEKNYCFWLIKDNGTFDDVSYHSSIRHIKVISSKNIDLILPFGKYKGQSIYDIKDDNYLNWLLKLPNLSRDLKVKVGQFVRYGYIPFNPMTFAGKIKKNHN